MQEIPLTTDQDQAFNIILGEQGCYIRVYETSDGVYLDLSVQDRQVVTSARCAADMYVLLYRYIEFKGNLLFVSDDGSNLTSSNFGTNVRLYYVAEGE